MRFATIAGVALAACTLGSPALPDNSGAAAPSADVSAKVTTVCQDCHGENGDSISPTFPRLNGQQADYIAAQLKNFRDHKRADPHAQAYMWGMAATLNENLIEGLAHYYASQPPTQPQSGGALAAEGRKIYVEGVAAQNIPSCQACHGEHGEGNGQFPRLAGQHAAYLTAQLESFRSLLRDNDIMHANTKDMTDRQIEAIVSYLAND
jgi:cytochrome c553